MVSAGRNAAQDAYLNIPTTKPYSSWHFRQPILRRAYFSSSLRKLCVACALGVVRGSSSHDSFALLRARVARPEFEFCQSCCVVRSQADAVGRLSPYSVQTLAGEDEIDPARVPKRTFECPCVLNAELVGLVCRPQASGGHYLVKLLPSFSTV
eukprot:8125602-Pyramimonas_sp.AAC.5